MTYIKSDLDLDALLTEMGIDLNLVEYSINEATNDITFRLDALGNEGKVLSKKLVKLHGEGHPVIGKYNELITTTTSS